MTKRMLLVTTVLIAATLLLGRALPVGADEGVEISLTPNTQELTVGDPVALTIEVRHPAGYLVIIPMLEQMWGPLEVRSQSQATVTANDDGTETTSQVLVATLFALGEFETPPLWLTISDASGRVTEQALPAAKLTVVPTLADDDSEIRDIKPQAAMAVPPIWPWFAGGLAVAVAAAVAGWWAIRRWQGKPFLLGPAVDNRPAWQVAYDELARIEGLTLIEKRWFKEYYTLVTDTLRTYLEKEFDLRVFDRTTSELRSVLRQSDLDSDAVRETLALFAESDLVKFAQYTPDAGEARQATAVARSIVDRTRPRPGLAAAPDGGEPSPASTGGPQAPDRRSGSYAGPAAAKA